MTSCFRIRVGKTKDKRAERCPKPAVDEPVSRSDMDNLSLGVEFTGGKMYVLIPSNTKIPKRKEKKFTTSVDYQSTVALRVYEGESSFTRDNVLIGKFVLDGIPPAPKRVPKLKLYFDIDANGTLRVSAKDTISCKLKEITITSEQRESAKMSNAKNTLQKYAEGIKKTVSDVRYAGKLKAAEKRKIMDVADESIRWLYMNQSAKIYKYKDEQKDLENLWNPIITKLYKDASLPKVENKSASSEVPESCIVTPKTAFNLNEVD